MIDRLGHSLASRQDGAGETPRGTLSIREAAIRSGLSVRAIQRAIQAGQLPVQQIAGRSGWEYRIERRDLESFAPAAAAVPAPLERRSGDKTWVARLLPGVGARQALPSSRWAYLALGLAVVALTIALARIISERQGLPPAATPTPAGRHAVKTGAGPTARGGHTPPPRPSATPVVAGSGHGCAGAHSHANGSACAPTVGTPSAIKTSIATTSTSFTLVIGKSDSARAVTVQGDMTLTGGLNPQMREVLLGCGTARNAPQAESMSIGGLHVTSTLTLPQHTIESLQRWAAAYSSIINYDDPRVTGFVTDDEHESFEREGISLWRQLRRQLGHGYSLRAFSEQRHSSLQVAQGEPCPTDVVTTRAALTAWLASVDNHTCACVGGYHAVAGVLTGIMHWSSRFVALNAAFARKRSVCAQFAVPPIPTALASDQAVRHAYAVISNAVGRIEGVVPALQEVARGNANGPQISRIVAALNTSSREYAEYERLAGTLGGA